MSTVVRTSKGVVVASRRHFIQYSLALSAASFPVVTAWASAAAPVTELPSLSRLARFVFDGRFPEAREAARHAAPAAAATVRVEGDLTALWYEDLDLEWKRGTMTLGGVTTRHGLFVLETLAADRGMRVVYRGLHEPADGRIVHTLSGPAAMLENMARPAAASFWPALGHAMTRYTASRETATVERASSRGSVSGPAEPLCSWIIAPRSAAARAV